MILVVAEQRDGAINKASLEAVVAARQVGDAVKAVLLGGEVEPAAAELAAAGVEAVLTVSDPALAAYTADGHVIALEQVIAAESPELVILPHTYQTRDFAPALATRLGRPIVTDCVGLGREGSTVTFTRPMFQGKVLADVVIEAGPPLLATVQVGAFKAEALEKAPSPAPIVPVTVAIADGAIRQRPEAPFREARQAVDLTRADRIVAVGRGIKGEEHLEIARGLASALDAEIAASRPICDNGWLPMDRQIGSSGQTVAPKLYVALGISGAIQHVVGMKGARVIVAVNKDPEAPIFEISDYGIVGDLFDVVPAIVKELSA